MRLRRSGQTQRLRVELLPLMDVMFLLLVFFIYLSLVMTVRHGIRVELARTGSAEQEDSARPIVVTVREDGSLHLGTRALADAAALAEAIAAERREEDQKVVLNADRHARHGDVVGAMEAIRSAGIREIIQAVEPRE